MFITGRRGKAKKERFCIFSLDSLVFHGIKASITVLREHLKRMKSIKRKCVPYFSLNEGLCRELFGNNNPFLSSVNTINEYNFHQFFTFPEDPKWRVVLQPFWILPAGFSWCLSFCFAQSLLSFSLPYCILNKFLSLDKDWVVVRYATARNYISQK